MFSLMSSGRIEVITGAMFSGKTRELISRAERAEIAGNSIKAFKPSIDDRYEEEKISSHVGRSLEAEVLEPEEDLAENFEDLKEDVVIIDEANFFPDELVEVCQNLAEGGKRVILAGTDQTFRGEPFPPLPKLCAIAEEVEKLNAVCVKCGGVATRNQRLVDGEPAEKDSPTILVGAEESYEARCRHCHELR
ncbi:thymidine kinase [Candidatus Nanohalococcus occultus]